MRREGLVSRQVAPHTGAWIETYSALVVAIRPDRVAPHTGAWIETRQCGRSGKTADVAPHTGAWIETGAVASGGRLSRVAPHTGAWIETCRPCLSTTR